MALDEGDDAGEDRHEEQRDGTGEQPAQAAVGAELRAALAVRLGDARVEEAALGRVELGRCALTQSVAATSRAPRYRSDGSRPPASHSRAASPS